MAVLREIAAVQFFGAKFQKFFGCVSGIRFAVSLAFDCAPRGVRGNGQSVGFLVSLGRPLHKVPIRPRNPKLGVCPHLKHGGRHLRQSFARSGFTHRSAKRDTKAVENVRLPANIRGALSNLKKTGIIADAVDASDRTAEFCDRSAAAISCNMHKPS